MEVDVMSRPVEILLVEDSRGDALLVDEALKAVDAHCHLHVVTDGEAAMLFLNHEAPYGDAVRPDIVLLDLNLPRKSGRAVLREIKANADLKRIPVIVMTMSDHEEDVRDCYDSHANCYIIKPIEMKVFREIVRGINDYWFSMARLPVS